MKKNESIHIYICIFLILSAIIMIDIYISVAYYSVLSNDDFLHTYQMITSNNYEIFNNNIKNALMYSFWHYMSLGEQYFAMFLHGLFGANPNIDILKTERVFMVMNVLLYFVSLFCFIYQILKNIFLTNIGKIKLFNAALFVYLSFIIVLYGFDFYYDVFTWFSGATSYTIPLSMYFISMALYFFNKKKKNTILMIIAIIITILAMGGNICISIFATSLSTVIGILLITTKKLDEVYIVQYIQCIMFTIINAISPGNVNRAKQNLGKSAIDIIIPLQNTFLYLRNRIIILVSKHWMIICLLIFASIIAFLFYRYKVEKKHLILNLIFFPIVPIASTFIVAYGYGLSDLGMSHIILENNVYDRISFLMDFSIIVLLLLCTVLIFYELMLILEKYKIKKHFIVVIMSVVFCSLSLILLHSKTTLKDNMQICIVTENLLNDKYKNYYEKYKLALSKLEANKGSDNVNIEILNTIPCHMPFSSVGLDLYYGIKNVNIVEATENAS